jgi:hypothetical protein
MSGSGGISLDQSYFSPIGLEEFLEDYEAFGKSAALAQSSAGTDAHNSCSQM